MSRRPAAARANSQTKPRSQHRSLRHDLAQRELANPAPWVNRTFGQRPARSLSNDWDHALRTAEYRLDHNITCPNTPLGPQPAGKHEPQHREQAQQTIEQDQRNLGRDHDQALDIEIGL